MKRILYVILLLAVTLQGKAMSVPDSLGRADFDEFRKSMRDDFGSFRKEIMEEYIEFVRNPWESFEDEDPIPAPVIEPIPPIVRPDVVPDVIDDTPPRPIDILPLPVGPAPQPKPVEPIDVEPLEIEKYLSFTFFGTHAKVRLDAAQRVELNVLSESGVADALSMMSSPQFDAVISDCLEIRERLALSDWAYIKMLETISDKAYGGHTNSSVLFMAYIYMQSGYKMRMAIEGNRLYMLFASKHLIYDRPYYTVAGDRYCSLDEMPSRMRICQASFRGESPLSLQIVTDQKFGIDGTKERKISSKTHNGVDVAVSVNRNMLDFYSSYPTSMIGDNMLTRWAMYATAPMSSYVKEQLYPVLKEHIKGVGLLEAANRLLGLVQTGLIYGYDDEIWGGDRAFFPEESLFYDYCDCEDRSILFTRLVTELLGLDVAIVYVPGHLLAAIRLPGDVKGEAIYVDGEKYILCEPTCTNGAPVGWASLEAGVKLQAIRVPGKH